MNNQKNRYESGTIKGKMRELLSISFFALISALLALFLADLIFFPLAFYAVRNVDIFNILFKYTARIAVLSALAALLFFKIRSLRRDGYSTGSIVRYILVRPFQYAGFFIFSLILVSLIIAVIYFIFSSNYYYLHRLAGGV